MSTILSVIVGLNFFQSIQVAITSQNYFKTELNVRIYISVITMIMRNRGGRPSPSLSFLATNHVNLCKS